ncbi:HD domain-containing protein [Alkalihalobacillus sp. MEB130]|uniref:HD domain-containing protein n=1 Tax=Alkalihalobacillus sp. MEB130 TaxID=2976704 RepID=UPI0028DD5F9E|nr:HD domain-containing protein [Alkalihalobacillus sp. MEB130]MDT8861194.1 HD domain-containing protein [Alkalihalobacillus sp. MEB130]
MLLTDSIFGHFEITGVLEELIISSAVQRLKGIHQGGASFLVNDLWKVTRYDHSIGVMLLIRKLGGSVEEQVAGLLHDVSHTAFSHVIDYVFDNQNEDYHEEIFDKVVVASSIPQILKKYGYDYREILEEQTKWSILEQPAPDLCADRIEYTLRDMFEYGYLSKGEIEAFLNDLIVVDDKVHMRTIEQAEWFVEVYYREVIDFFMDPLNVYAYELLAQVIKRALDLGYLHLNDMLLTDKEVILKLENSKDDKISSTLRNIHTKVQVVENPDHYHIHRRNKVRLIDPLLIKNGKKIRSSVLSSKVRNMNEVALRKATNGAYVEIISS